MPDVSRHSKAISPSEFLDTKEKRYDDNFTVSQFVLLYMSSVPQCTKYNISFKN